MTTPTSITSLPSETPSILAQQPVFFQRNRVYRVYKGGKLFADFFGDAPEDGNYPEEWVASRVKAMNLHSTNVNEGLSLLDQNSLSFKELLEQEPHLMLGEQTSFDVLVKILDSAIRLPLQAHPDPAFSQKYFNSTFGKTEMWLILATRPDAKLYFGFHHAMTKEEFAQAVAQSRHQKDIMTPLLNEITPQAGEVYLIPAKCVHAIGYGCLLLEVQEPTDFTIQPEYWCGDYLLDEYEMYLGVDPEAALDCFDYSVHGTQALALGRRTPKVIEKASCYQLEDLITYQDTPCFAVQKLTIVQGEKYLTTAPAIYVVLEGEGEISNQRKVSNNNDGQKPYHRKIKKGDYFFLPHAAKNNFLLCSQTNICLAICLPRQSPS